MSNFDPELFMQQTVDAPMETEYKLVPTGEFKANIDDFTSEAFQEFEFEYKKGPKAGQEGAMQKFTCPFVILDEQVAKDLGRERAIVDKQFILDIDPSTGGLDWGVNKNVELGRLRAAVNQNNPGPWTFAQLRGAGPVMIKVVHKDFKRTDGSKGKRAEVERVTRIS